MVRYNLKQRETDSKTLEPELHSGEKAQELLGEGLGTVIAAVTSPSLLKLLPPSFV